MKFFSGYNKYVGWTNGSVGGPWHWWVWRDVFIQRCNSNTEFIPGPAGNTQVLMLNRESDEPQNTQQLMKEMTAAGDARDFNSNAWKWACRFVQYHGKHVDH